MSRPTLFLDSSALFAGVVSPQGAARVLLLLAEVETIVVVVSEQVVAETERALARKAPRALPFYREALRSAGIRIVRPPSPAEVEKHQRIVSHPADVPILVAAMKAGVDYLVTLDRRHFLNDPGAADRSGLRIGTPGEALEWVRGRLIQRENPL